MDEAFVVMMTIYNISLGTRPNQSFGRQPSYRLSNPKLMNSNLYSSELEYILRFKTLYGFFYAFLRLFFRFF